MNDKLLTMFEYAVENNLWDMFRGLYPKVIKNYNHDQEVMVYVEEATKLMNIRLKNRKEGYRSEK